MIKANFDFFDFSPAQFSTFLPLPLDTRTHVQTLTYPIHKHSLISQHSRAHTLVTYPVDSDDTKAEAVGVERVDEGGGGDGAGDDYLHDVVEVDGKQVVTLTPVTDTVVTQVRGVTYVSLQLNREAHQHTPRTQMIRLEVNVAVTNSCFPTLKSTKTCKTWGRF